MLDITYTRVKLVTAHRKRYVANVCHDTAEGGKGSSLTGKGACDFRIAPVAAGWIPYWPITTVTGLYYTH